MSAVLLALSLISGGYEMLFLMIGFREYVTWRIAIIWLSLVIITMSLGGSGFKLMAPSPSGLFLDHPDCLCDHLYEFSVVVHPVDFNVTGGNLFECA